jgi:hypothetical protein
MSRPVRGREVLDDALKAIAAAKTIEQLRQAQAVAMPLQYDMSLTQTAQAIGISPGWVCRLRNQFIRGEIVDDGGKPTRGGRRNENFTHEQETELLKPFFNEASVGGILVVGEIKPKLEAALGREMGLSTLYKLLHRHNWRKLAPDKHHPKSDPVAQEAFKKNSPKHSLKSAKTGRRANRSA